MKYFVLLIIAFLPIRPFAQSISLFEEIQSHDQGMKIWWIGHNGWLIKSGDLIITTDILLDYDKRIHEPLIRIEELAQIIDVTFITHGHRDHFNRSTSKYLARNSDCLFVIPESCIPIAEELEVPQDRIIVATPRESFNIGRMHVEPIRAIHGNANFAIYYDANLTDCGYVITLDGKKILQPGDSYLLEDHLFLENVDVLFFSPTEHNMYIDRSVILINHLSPEYIFPQHHSTVAVNESTRFWAKGYPEEVRIRLSKPLQNKYHILKEGQGIVIK